VQGLIRFFSGGIWSGLQTAAEKSARPAAVAVAYFGRGASRLLPLPKGSRLVVDASDNAVKNGQTCPAELKRLVLERGVLVYSAGNLHAKVFVVGSTAFIGSANASTHSESDLIEALVVTTDHEVVKAARSFVHGLCLQELGPKELDRLQSIYRPPRMPSGAKSTGRKRSPALRPLRIINLVREDLPDGAKEAEQAGTKAARKLMSRPRRHVLDNFRLTGRCPIRPGDTVVQIVEEYLGNRMVYPPANVVHTNPWIKGATKITFVHVEYARSRRVEVGRLAKKIGRGARDRLLRDGIVSKDFARRLLMVWNR
jgi:PLD-like domain